MSKSDIGIRIVTEGQAKTLQALSDIERAQKTIEQNLGKMSTAAQRAAQADRELTREAKQVAAEIERSWRAGLSPIEKYNDRFAQLQRLYDAGKISVASFRTRKRNGAQ